VVLGGAGLHVDRTIGYARAHRRSPSTDVTPAPASSDFEPGEEFAQPVLDPPCGGPGEPACPPSDTVSGGAGGYIPVAAERVLDTRAAPAGAIGRGETRVVAIGGMGSVPPQDVQAVVLSITASKSLGWSSLTVWPTGSLRPDATNLETQPGRPRRNLAIVPLGADGAVSVYNDRGHVEVVIDVLGWIAGASEFQPVASQRLFDSGPTKAGKPAPIGPGRTVKVAVAGRAGVPVSGVGAVVLNVSSRTSTNVSDVTIWPTDAERPAEPSLVAQPSSRRDNVVVVAPGADVAVSVHNETGRTHLSIDVVGWFPTTSSYRALSPALLLDTNGGAPLAAGSSVDISVAGIGGVPALDDDAKAEEARSVVVNVIATPLGQAPTTLTL